MPSHWKLSYRDTLRWLKCREAASRAMLAEGWNKHARKFHNVMMRRAVRLYLAA